MHLTRVDREGDIQRRYQCRDCDQDMLVANCEAPDTPKDFESPAATVESQPPLSDYERKITALESQLALIDQEIANSQQVADKQESELMRAKLGVGDLRKLEAVTAKHTQLLTLLNELHRMQYSKALVLAETEHEKDQLRSHLAIVQASSAETESFLQAELDEAKKARDLVIRENQDLKQRALSLEGELRSATDTLAGTQKERDAANRELNARSAENALAERELNCQLNAMRSKLDQAEASAEQEQNRLHKKVRALESELSRKMKLPQSNSHEAAKQTEDRKAGSHFIDTKSANTEVEQSEPVGTHSLANTHYQTGVKYVKGTGVKMCEQTAIEYFQQAANLGHTSAQHNLGVLLYKGPQGVRDLKASVFWLTKASSQGHEKAVSLLPEVEVAYQMYDQDIAI
ncbi:MAG: hypothetical protein AB8B48_04855 [Pseudomonadales bacterium]